MKFHFRHKMDDENEIELESESLSEFEKFLPSLASTIEKISGALVTVAETSLKTQETTPKKDLTGIIERTDDGPLVTVAKGVLSDNGAIAVMLYTKDPEPLTSAAISHLILLSGRNTAGVYSRLSELKKGGIAVLVGGAYRLSARGRQWVENELLPKIAVK